MYKEIIKYSIYELFHINLILDLIYMNNIAPKFKLSCALLGIFLSRKQKNKSIIVMEKFTPEYSLKNIAFLLKHEFVLSLTDK